MAFPRFRILPWRVSIQTGRGYLCLSGYLNESRLSCELLKLLHHCTSDTRLDISWFFFSLLGFSTGAMYDCAIIEDYRRYDRFRLLTYQITWLFLLLISYWSAKAHKSLSLYTNIIQFPFSIGKFVFVWFFVKRNP